MSPFAASRDQDGVHTHEFDVRVLRQINPRCFVLMDSERPAAGAEPKRERLVLKKKCEGAGIPIHLTERRSIENYLTPDAINEELGTDVRHVDPYEKLDAQVTAFKKKRGGTLRVAERMSWADIAPTDIGVFVQGVLEKLPKR